VSALGSSIPGPQVFSNATAVPTACRCCADSREFFSLDSASIAPPYGQLTFAASSSLSLFTVPQGKRLVLTNLEMNGGYIQLTEVKGSDVTVKRGATWTGSGPGEYHSSTGLRFDAGSQVTLENVVPYDQQFFAYTMTGYL